MPEKPQETTREASNVADAPRCVCGYPKSHHAPGTLACPHNPGQVYGTLDLPEGRTCGDCFNFKRTCEWLISCEATRTRCDWYPIRFIALTRSVNEAAPTASAPATVSQENANADR